jgi:hypothetical protein
LLALRLIFCGINFAVFTLIFILAFNIMSLCPEAGMSGDRIQVGARFFKRIQTCSWAHPAYYGHRVTPGNKAAGRGVKHPLKKE